MELLPDDVLLEVLGHVDVEDLFSCRLVCKRLGGLAVHPDAWRRRTLHPRDPVLCPVVRLAPCLSSLPLLLPSEGCHWPYRIGCAVEELVLHVERSAGAVHAALLIERQLALGRLKRLRVIILSTEFVDEQLDETDARVLFETLASATASGLECLTVCSDVANAQNVRLPATCTLGAVPSTMRALTCTHFPRMEPLFDLVLSSHAATLESVAHITADMTSAVGLLAGLPRLRKLSCELHPGLDALVACKALTDLTVMVEREDAQPAGAVRLLGQACQLRKVALVHGERPSCVAAVEELLLALASPARPAAETLEVTHTSRTPWTPSPVSVRAEPLLGALSRLPALRELTLDWESDQLLRGVRPGTTPALMSLDLRTQRGDTCGHGWVHNEDFMAFMLANPSLHVRVANWECDCEFCEDPDCHHQLQCDLWDHEGAYFYSHPEDQCPWQHEDDHDDGIWVRIPLDS
ncbi:uncharacterized protein LOC127749021 isoform X1 [Frankliniella occidentalis]|uniref:Uncharacterized protein LOC127749021 isoform X1 n=1 Tax=Frankliniella occidentalis TaxID=133901 RepID=A0A9C6U5A8_FRAOC|nr:uncharacterized protein LOC127749021 isoform X1 [Frankliniella occidentalis]XP_052121394.1 uncharacterized protein LOC127749021 isoform X1 [Frankliniella occidentalis]